MLNYKNLQKLIAHLNKCIGSNWHNLTIKDVEQYDGDDYSTGSNILFEDIIVIDCTTKINHRNVYFALRIFNNKDKFHIYITYIPGDNKLLHDLLKKHLFTWNSDIGGYLMDNSDNINIESPNKVKAFVQVLDNSIKK